MQPTGYSGYDPEQHHRRSIRLTDYDYSQSGAYFITIVAQNRMCLFGEVVDGVMQLNDAGRMIATEWRALPTRFPTVQLDAFVAMPNHIHSIIVINPVGAPLVGALSNRATGDIGATGDPGATGDASNARATTRVAPTVGDVVGAYKSLATVHYTRGVTHAGWPSFVDRLWQRNYYEHIIHNTESLNRIHQYIMDNPTRWADDPENPVGAPLVGARFDAAPFGNRTPTDRAPTDRAPTRGAPTKPCDDGGDA